MWFVGIVVGGAIGAGLGGFGGLIVGAVLGGLIGGGIGMNRAQRLKDLEDRVVRIEAQLASLRSGAAPVRAEPAAPPPEAERTPEAPIEPQAAPAVAEGGLSEAQATGPVPEPAPELAPKPAPTPLPQPDASRVPGLWERLIGGNLVAKVGVVILFFGVAFLLRYAYERIHVPIELRLTGAAALALALLAVGWRLRERHRNYALVLQGGGVGILYLVIFGAFKLFGLLPPALAFALLVVVAVSSAVLAVAQNSLPLAALGVAGGFLAPILASTGRGDHVALFSYYAVLNAAIVGIAWLRAWRLLNLLGFGFTLAIGWLWGARAYRPELFASTEPFLVLFFLMYVGIPILFARRRAVELKDYVDGTLVFGVPVFAFGFQAVLMRPFEYGAAWSALAAAALYVALATVLFRRAGENLRLLVESFIALALAFGTLAVPLAFEGRLTSATWALEGAAVVWIGVRQGRLLPRLFGYALQIAAGAAFLWDVGKGYDATPVLNSFYLGTLFVFLGAFFCAATLERHRDRLRAGEGALSPALLAWGALWWYGGGLHEIARHVDFEHRPHAGLLFFALSAAGASVLATARRWPAVRWLRLLLYPAIAVLLGREFALGLHPFAGIGAIAWGAALAVHFWLLARHDPDEPRLQPWLHAAGVWILAVLGSRELGWLIDRAVDGQRVWPSIAWALAPALLLAAVAARRMRARWPLSRDPRAYLVLGGTPLAVFLAAWTLYANVTKNGDPSPLPFVPVLNPLDIAMALSLVLIARWLAAVLGPERELLWQRLRTPVYAAFGAAGFVWVNGTLLRTLHHWAGLRFHIPSMLSSQLVQASFSILWTMLALGAMVVATRRGLRPLWIVGAVLMGVVVVKLFLVDLSGIGTVERIVSFIGVGLLMLLVGYLSPVPPKQESAR
jgi:uncharacterized membrane protein